MMNTEIFNYLELMKDSLIKKEKILVNILELTKEQEKLLNSESFEDKDFDKIITEKSILIEKINNLDEGFELIYKRIEDKIKAEPLLYKESIEKLQEIIRTLVDKGVEVETLERRNQIKFDMNVSKSKDRIRSYNLSSNAVTKYYSNMSGNIGEGTYFVDKKK